jgi:Fe-S-cluster-containing dehydrogenase component
MTYIITSQCIECHRCESICPTGAITQNEQAYQINAERCNGCVGHYAIPQCWAACPTNSGCVANLAAIARSPLTDSANDYWHHWFDTYDRLVSRLRANPSSDYWHHWFDTYSQILAQHLQTPTSVGVKA